MFNEQELIKALRRRDADAFTYLFETYSDRVYRLAFGLLENEDDAESVVQETFLSLFERLDQFEGRSKLSTWLYRVAYNKGVDLLRKRRPDTVVEADLEDDELPAPVILADWSQWPERLLSEAEIAAELDKAISSLPEKYRAIFLLREVEGLSTTETAQITNLTGSAVKVRLHRARLLLRERLAESLLALTEQEAR